MPDREKVIEGLKWIVDLFGNYERHAMGDEEMQTLNDAITLLKAQEPVLLLDQHKSGGHFINANSPWKSICPRCGKKIEGKQTRFCKYCGLAVK